MADGNDGPFTDEASFMVPSTAKTVELGPADADIVWRFDMLRDLPVFPHDATNCSILIAGDCAYVGTGNGVYDGKIVLPTAASLVALDKRTGRLLARDDGTISAGTFHGQWSSPTLTPAGGRELVVYGGGDGVCYGFELAPAAGDAAAVFRQAWKCDCNPPGYRERGGEPIDYWALVRGGARTLDGDGMLVSPNEIIGSPVYHDGRIYVTIGQDPLHGAGRCQIGERAEGAGLDVRIGGAGFDEILQPAGVLRKERDQHGGKGEADRISHDRHESLGRLRQRHEEMGCACLALLGHQMQQEVARDHVAIGRFLGIAGAARQHLRRCRG